jgi:hypothetical protein
VTVTPERLALLDKITLEAGGHQPDSRFCVMEAVAYVAGEPWSDSPECVSPVIAAFLRSWNDSLSDDARQMLKPLIPQVIGTRTSEADEQKRAWMTTDWLARECAPGFLRLAGLTDHAEALEGLAALTTTKRAENARPTLDAARAAARAAAGDAAGAAAGAAARAAARATAWDAAGDAARAAAWAAAGDAARDAARAAARAAAGDAAGAAAGAAARAAARAAAGAALLPTVLSLQSSALLLVERMIMV